MTKKIISLFMLSMLLFTLFTAGFLFSQEPAADLDNVIVYPNPCIFSEGHNKIIFAHLTEEVTIKIYTLKGKLIAEMNISGSGGKVEWDVTNSSGERLGSGLYLYLITDNQEQKAIGKIAIIR